MAPINQERHDLDTHVSLCAERYQQLENKLTGLEDKIVTVEKKVESSKTTLFNTLILTGGSIIVALIGAVSMILSAIK